MTELHAMSEATIAVGLEAQCALEFLIKGKPAPCSSVAWWARVAIFALFAGTAVPISIATILAVTNGRWIRGIALALVVLVLIGHGLTFALVCRWPLSLIGPSDSEGAHAWCATPSHAYGVSAFVSSEALVVAALALTVLRAWWRVA